MSDPLFASMAVSASGMSVQRTRMETVAKNIANAETTRSADGDVYLRRRVAVSSTEPAGRTARRAASHRVSLRRTSPMHLASSVRRRGATPEVPVVEGQEVVDPEAGYTFVYDPNHPDANAEGYVRMPDVNTVTEMIDMMSATRAYEANLSAMKAYQSMVNVSLEI